MLLNNIALFQQIVEKGSLSAAGREMGLSATTVSERLAALETHYGVVLLNRTTRSISLTDEGRSLFDGAKLVLGEVEDLESRIRLGAQALSGSIRISAPVDLGREVISREVNKFIEENPAVTVEFYLSDGYVDLVGEGIDIALRFGPVADSSLRAKSLGPKRRIVCAAPSYLEKHGVPRSPSDLQGHNCLVMRFGTQLDNVWKFGPNAMTQVITVKGNRIGNDGTLVREWCLAGYGIILKSELDVGPDIKRGKLVELLADFAPPPTPLHMIFPPSRAQPRRTRALAEQLAKRFDKMSKP